MAGVPTGRGCDACRKQKKKCDQAKPACARCTRLKLKCTGGGVKRFMFKSENSQAAGRSKAAVAANPRPSSGPSNDKTLTAANLVHIIDMDNPGYDISTYGYFVKDLPRHIGSSKPLDAAIMAFVAGFDTIRDKSVSRVDALGRYVYALKALRESMQDPVQAFSTDNMCSIYLISICQEWLGSSNAGPASAKHHEVLGHLLQNAVLNSQFEPSNKDFMQTIFAVVVLASFTNPNIELGSWFWQALSLLGAAERPLKSGHGMSFASLNIGTMGETVCLIREPDKHLFQLRCTYVLIQTEYPLLVEAAEAAVAQARRTGSTSLERRLGIRFHTGSAAMLTMAVIINRVLRSYDDDPALLEDAKRYVDDIIVLAQDASCNRPIAASSIASPLAISLAAMEDYRRDEVEKYLVEYQSDFPGLTYFDDVELIRKKFENIDNNNQTKAGLLLSSGGESDAEFHSLDTELGAGAGCTIL